MFFLSSSSFAQTPQNNLEQSTNARSLILSDSYTEHFLSPYLLRYGDANSPLTIDQILSTQQLKQNITNAAGSILCLPPSQSSVWLTFDVMNRSQQTKWKIDFGSSFMGRFGLFNSIESYAASKLDGTLIENKVAPDGTIKLDIPKNEKTQIILKLDSAEGLPATMPLRLLHYDQETALQNNSLLFISTILLIGMVFFFIAVALMKKNYNFLYFSLYYILFTALLLIQNGVVGFTIPLIGSRIIPLLFLAIAITSMMTAKLFWNMEEASRFSKISFIGFIGLSVFCFMSAIILPIADPALKALLQFGPTMLILTLIPLISIVQSRQGNDEATPFLFGWFILLFGMFISLLAISDFMPAVSTAINAYWYTLIPQAIFFVVATRIKFNITNSNMPLSHTLEINETDSVSRLRKSKENTEQERLLRVIEKERKVMGELRKSESRRAEEMRKAKDEADLANKAKSAFLAVVSHEIRTPMTGVMGMVRLLLDSNLTKEQKEYAQTIQDSSDAMLALLNDILDFEKIEQGQMSFENISFDLHRLLQGVAALMKGHATQKSIELKTKIGDNLPKYVKGDPTRLRQVLLNLTGNAVKFTDEGHVTITAELMAQNDSTGKFEIYFGVTDSGIGIPKSAQKDLFSPFSQADSSISRKFGGTGLGLAISKGLIEGMGSEVNINSNEGEGSTFFFTLKMEAGQGETISVTEEPTAQNNGSQPMNILIVDDNEINQKVIRTFLEKKQHKTDTADDAQIALQKIERETYDLVLMDIELPGMRGDEATTKIRQSSNQKIKDIPIIALTGNVMPNDIERFYAAGMNGVLAKPIDVDILEKTVRNAHQGIFEKTHVQTAETTGLTLEENDKKEVSPEEITIEKNIKEEIITVFKPDTIETLTGHLSAKDIQDMIDDMFEKVDEIIGKMNEALEANDMPSLSERGHELKGMTGNFGFMEISDQAGDIEQRAKTDTGIILTGLVSTLPEMQKRAKEALHHWLENQN